MTFPEALARSRAAYAMGLTGGTVPERGAWWEASERLGLLHRAREQAKRPQPLLRDRWPATSQSDAATAQVRDDRRDSDRFPPRPL